MPYANAEGWRCPEKVRAIEGTALAIIVLQIFVVASDRCEDCEVMKRSVSIVWLALIFFLVLPCPAWAWPGKVVGVADGDTITVLRDKQPQKIRLYGIDRPEKRQPFGNKAKQFASEMVFGKTVEVHRIDTDRYGRTVALVWVGRILLNEMLITAGLARVYPRYCRLRNAPDGPDFKLPRGSEERDCGSRLIAYRRGNSGDIVSY
jgi:endonuclease YncB( thermonuclease family)